MNKRKRSTKHLLVTLTLFSFLLNSTPSVKACGSYQTETLFSYAVRPDNFKSYAAGNLGVLQPKYARSYLVVAYRFLNEMPLDKEQQEQMIGLWNYRLGLNDEKARDEDSRKGYIDLGINSENYLTNWFKIRNKVLGSSNDNLSINDLFKSDYGDFNSYVNCTESGFKNAAETLAKRYKNYSDETENLREWINGQDAVFTNCSTQGKLPKNVDSDSPEWLKNDRAYQIAAAHFYGGNYTLAIEKFKQIANDDSSEWQAISNYLVARTYLRIASRERKLAKEFTAKAEAHLMNVVKNESLKEIHRISRQLLYVAANRYKTKDKFRKFSKVISSEKDIPDMRSEVEIYTNYLDRFGIEIDEEIEVNEEKIAEKIEAKPKTVEPEEQTFWEWLWSFIFETKVSAATKDSDSETSPTEENNTDETSDEDDEYDYYMEEPTLKNSMHFSSEIDFEKITETALQEDISAWIFALQANDKSAYEYSLKMWQKTSKNHWLLAAISNAEVEYDETEMLINQADKIKFDLNAFPTIKYHQVRLLIEQNKSNDARTELDGFLRKSDQMPLSTQNRFFAQRMLVAINLDEFLKFAQRKALAYSSYSYHIDETSEIGAYGSLDARDKGMLLWRKRWMFDKDSTEIFNNKMPLKMLMQAGVEKKIPVYLRKGILISALTRAILLENKTAQRQIARDLSSIAPEMSAELTNFYQTPNQLTTFKLLIDHPVMQPLVDKGFGRFIIPPDSLSFDRDNWWYRYELKNRKLYTGESLIPDFLSKNDLKLAESERQKLFDKGFTGEILSGKAVLAARSFPNERELPKLLYKTLQANRYGDNGGKNRKNTRTVFQTLHKRFPKSVWTKKSPIWY